MPESYVPECHIIMLGCQALSAFRVAPDRMSLVPFSAIATPGNCQVCGSGVRDGDDDYYCSKCDSVSPDKQDDINKALRVERIGVESKSRAEVAENKALMKLRALENQRRPLTEVERRRMWNGYRGGIFHELANDLTNVAKVCRDWLCLIGQEPNWSLVLDGRGNVTGTRDPGIIS